MAAITAVKLTTNAGILCSGAVTTTSTAGAWVDVSTMDGSKVILLVNQAGTDAGTIKVTDGAEFTAGAVGNITKLTTGAADYVLGPFETSRVKDSNGYINIANSSVSTSVYTVRAIILP